MPERRFGEFDTQGHFEDKNGRRKQASVTWAGSDSQETNIALSSE